MRRAILILLSMLLLITPCGCGNETLNFWGASNEATSILVSDEVFKRSENVVISATSEGISLWSGTAFAGILDAPILLYENKESIDAELKRLKAKNIYIFGNIDYTPEKAEQCVRFSVPETVTADTAKYIKENLGYNYTGAFLVTSNVEAAAVAPHAYKQKMPILMIDKKIIPETVFPHIAETNYLVGHEYRDIVLNALGNSFRMIQGTTIPELTGYANEEFNDDTTSIIVVKDPVELATSASLAKSKNAAVVYYNGRLTAFQENFLHDKSTDKIYTVGTGTQTDIVASFKNDCANISKNILQFDSSYTGAIFYVPHQDDETVFHSQVICKAIEVYGAENVKVVLFTNGGSSSTKNSGIVGDELNAVIGEIEKRTNTPINKSTAESLRTALFSQARDNEILHALLDLGVLEENIRSIGLDDGNLETIVPDLESIIAQYRDRTDLLHFTFSLYYDSHPDHRAIGQALFNVMGESAPNVYFFARFDTALKTFFEETENYDSYRKIFFEQTPTEKLSKAINEYNTFSCDRETIASEIAANLNSGMSAKDAVKNSESAKSMFIAVGFNSVRNLFLDLTDQMVSGNIATVLHKPFIRTVSEQ